MKNQVFLLITLIITLFTYQTQAQCPTGTTTLITQADVNNFIATYPNCQNLTGNLIIGGSSSSNLSDINSLAGLSIVRVGGLLTVRHNPMLADLSGFSMLTSVGLGLTVFNNDALTDLSGLDMLTSVGAAVNILNNDMLANLSGLDQLNYIGTGLTVQYNSKLISLMGLGNIVEVPRHANISDNACLASMSGLTMLVEVGGDFDIKNNPKMTSLTGLEQLLYVGGSLRMFGNFQLTSLDALSNLKDVCENLQLFKNFTLEDCVIPIMCLFIQDPNFDLFLESNGEGCDTSAEIEAGVIAENVDCATAEIEANYCNFLAAELIALDANPKGRSIVLSWETATENNNQGFEVQRSRDGVTWEIIAWKEGSGNSSARRSYTHVDYNTYKGVNYYRLKQIDFSGNANLSATVSQTLDVIKGIDIYPNPASEYLVISGLDGQNMDEIIIHDLTGKEALRLTNTGYQIDISNLSPGMYVVAIIAGFDEEFLKLVIE